MGAEQNDARRLLRAVDGELALDHEGCRPVLAAYVEAQRRGERADQLYPQVQQHLDVCEDCDAEYAALLDLAILEEKGGLPLGIRRPEVDFGFLPAPAVTAYVQGLKLKIIPYLLPNLERPELITGALEGSQVREAGVGAVPDAREPGHEVAWRLVAAMYKVTQVLVDGGLPLPRPDAVKRLAEAEAVRQHIEAQLARAFGARYVEVLEQNYERLKALIQAQGDG